MLKQSEHVWKTSVIRVEVIAPEKLLDVNTFPKNNLNVDSTIYIVSKYLSVDMVSCDIQI
jgi:hypothetical protein